MRRSVWLSAMAAVVASAGCGDDGNGSWAAELRPVNGSGVSGEARFTREGNELEVAIDARDLVADRIHEQTINGTEPESSQCPTDADDRDGDGVLSAREAQRALGRPVKELSPYPTLGDEGDLHFRLTYITRPVDKAERRAFTVDADAVLPLEGRTVVLYGVEHDGRYRPELPAACGVIRRGGSGEEG